MFISKKEIEIRYAETDQMGVVYHANYLVWMEIGRTQLIKDLGFSYAELEKRGIVSPVVDLSISYKRPTHYGETVTIKTWIQENTGVQTSYAYEVVNEQGEVCIEATSRHVCVNKEDFRPIIVKRVLPEWHKVYEENKYKVEE
ncbi:acyl-CoA thioesterase [Priestia taiwanensis]|uniref:Acyl-CoA thioesterase YneP n=1 Tax=Priestia taiwanensis TaxID=1347902 RepID=A0A917AN86_9BACI|nr:thioesterase family protein [Priestia taiwanensis]MBM7362482.1 acyl-CoA thioester hydrolase [Priestia taiwanensis]GGE62572.1 putative acyl-CoA thioesterase YneP [Priestia taiwanensis]